MSDILTDEQVKLIENRVKLPYFHTTLEGTKDVNNLIATLRHVQAENEALGQRLLKWQEQSWDCEHMNKLLSEEFERLQQDSARLQAERDNARQSYRDLQKENADLLFNISQRVQENARLREALTSASEQLCCNCAYCVSETVHIINKALATEGSTE